ncbi:Ady4p [Lachancea thermotolerans CBS 6340]|uniref:KLTH0E09966p n=1 Tax=Lachancea thermotolerans (strain ATCC 56472 / CBS 6340 / NRRL Y-8284) TaxID=559295 RepID=C5DI61_LACTC|nr:KLTH0E09966p [Lachancea thermotolerans CBS 6340]CAR23472.1 KLTH0E09966p [Lachancea thermotolerans CBS 6340]
MLGCPLECFHPLLDRCSRSRHILENKLERELITHPELDLEVEPRFLVKSILRNKPYNREFLELKLKQVVWTKTMIAFFDYFDGEFGDAFFELRWILQFLHEVRKFPGVLYSNLVLSLDYERSLSLLCSRSLIKSLQPPNSIRAKNGVQLKVNRLNIFEGLLTNILDCTEPSVLTCVDVVDYYMMDQLFTVLGEVERSIAFLKGTVCDAREHSKYQGFVIRAQRTHIDSMIRKYILASTFKLPGDPTFIKCFDGVLDGILLYGGIHICVILFFYKVKEFFQAKHYALKQNKPPLEAPRPPCVAIIDGIILGLGQEIESRVTGEIQCPQVLVKADNHEILMVDTVFEESENDHNHDITILLSAAKLKAKKKLRGGPQVHQKYVVSQWQIGLSWVSFWEVCYTDNKGVVPHELQVRMKKVRELASSSMAETCQQ